MTARRRLAPAMLALALLALSGCATLPTAAPTSRQLIGGLKPGDAEVIEIVPGTRSGEAALQALLLPWAIEDGQGANDRFVAGDGLTVTAYEIGYPLFGSIAGSEATSDGPNATTRGFPVIIVPENGMIEFPYAGKIQVAGLSPDEVSRQLEALLRSKSRFIQILVTAQPGPGRAVLLSGDVARPGRVALSPARERLLDAVALAGGPTARRADTIVRLTRGSAAGELRLDEISADERQNVVLAPGDRVELARNTRTLTVLGAAQKVTEVPFDSVSLMLSEALARAGGPLDDKADARGVFIFRYETRLRGGETVLQPVIYRLNLLDPASYFAAQRFQMREKDVMLIANAQSNQISKFVQMINQLATPVLTVDLLTRP